MKKLYVLSLALLVFMALFMQHQTLKAQSVNTLKEQQAHLLGPSAPGDLQKTPYSEWFNNGYESYTPDIQTINQLKTISLKDCTIRMFIGTWCNDSRREIPRFLKILETIGFSPNSISMIGLGMNDSLYKQSPTHEELGENIYRVPTFIIYKKGFEINRIVESPVFSLERDLLTILKNEVYSPNYRSYPFLIKWLDDGLLADDNISHTGLANQIKYSVRSEGELNAFGYVLLKQEDTKIKEAIKIFRMNYYLYPESYLTCTALAEALGEAGYHQEAMELIKRSTLLNKKPENINYLFRLYEKVRNKSDYY